MSSAATGSRPATAADAIARAHEAYVFGSDDGRAVRCPHCDAAAGDVCRSTNGKAAAKSHAARARRARQGALFS